MADEETEFNPNSFNAVMGRVIERLEQGDNTMKELRDTTEKLNDTIACLPCSSHEERIKMVEEKKTRNSDFWHDVKIAVISAGVTGVITALLFIFTGIPGG